MCAAACTSPSVPIGYSGDEGSYEYPLSETCIDFPRASPEFFRFRCFGDNRSTGRKRHAGRTRRTDGECWDTWLGSFSQIPIFQAGHGSEPAANMPTPQYSPDEQEAVNHIYDQIIQRSFPSPPEPALRTIGSAAPAQLTSPHLIELKNFLIGVRKERDEIEQSLSNHKAALLAARRNLEKLQEQVVGLRHKQQRARNSIFRGLLNWRVAKIDRKIAHLGPDISSAINAFKIEKSAVEDLELRLEETWVDGNLALPGPAQAAWDEVTSKFEAMAKSFGIWDITADREKKRSRAVYRNPHS